MRQTAWSKSTLPSDRLAPSRPMTPKASPRPSASPSPSPSPAPKSKAVRALETLLAGLRAPVSRDLKGGCFCLARSHGLSLYTPLCFTCGLVLCERNPPSATCPSCATPLLATPALRAQMAERVQGELDAQILAEERAAERARDEARARAGAFPTLPGHGPNSSMPLPPPPPPPVVQQPQTHKVLSIGGGGKGNGKGRAGKVTLSSYTTNPAAPVLAQAQAQSHANKENDIDDGPPRVPPPPSEPLYARKLDGARPWEDRRPGADNALYVPLKVVQPPAPSSAAAAGSATGRRRKRKGAGAGAGRGDGASDAATVTTAASS